MRICPICLEAASSAPTEQCENHHATHRECARKMLVYMPLRCPLCRSKMVCPKCRKRKTRLWCECSSDVWVDTKKIYYAHLLVAMMIVSSPVRDVLLGLILLLANSVVMMRRVIGLQRVAEDVKTWNPVARWMLILTHLGMEAICCLLGLMIAALGLFYVQSSLGIQIY